MTLGIGSSFAGYRIERLIARGGMGEVYAARHTLLDRVDALKLLRGEFADDDTFRERFLREANLAASVRHPAVVPVYTAGEVAGRLYLVMFFVEGSDLREVLKQRRSLDAPDVLRIVTAVAGALDAAHRRGLVHRDVKPGNILLSGVDAAPDVPEAASVYLTDFGITRLQAVATGLTQEGAFLGSAGYVAPEQVAGAQVDSRTDLYSLACVAYECLTGVLPFPRGGAPAMLSAHLHNDPPPPSRLTRSLDRNVDAVLLRALSKNPENRQDTCREFAQDLAQALTEVRGVRVDTTVSWVREPAAVDAPRPRWDLAVTGGPLSGLRIPLLPGRVAVGRGEQADIRLADRFLSRLHVLLEVGAEGEVTVSDGGSANGTSINGTPLRTAVALRQSDVVEVGASLLEIRQHRPPGTTRPGTAGPPAVQRRQEDLVRTPVPPPGRRSHVFRRVTEEELDRARQAEVARRRRLHPDAVQLLDRLADDSPLVWSRRPGEGSFLDVRLGFGDVPWAEPAAPESPSRPAVPPLGAVPLTYSLGAAGTLSLAGDRPMAEASARWILLQAAASCAPADLRIVVALPTSSPLDWSWVPLLPHAGPGIAANSPAWAAERRSARTLVSSVLERTVQADVRGARRAVLLVSEPDLVDQSAAPSRSDVHLLLIGGTAGPTSAMFDPVGGRVVVPAGQGVLAGTPDGLTSALAREAALLLARLRSADERD